MAVSLGRFQECSESRPQDVVELALGGGPTDRGRTPILRPEEWASWLYLTKPEGELLRPLLRAP
jgi:hypothetical protein